jgi:squalene-hopene/tetraprenyl-beta-curcumene cyclase
MSRSITDLHSGCGRAATFASAALLAVATLVVAAPARAADNAATTEATRVKIVNKGIEYLRTKGMAKDGSYSSNAGIGVTALVVTSLLRNGGSPDNPQIATSLKLLESYVQSDGGVYKPQSKLRNYETCLALMCFHEANKSGKYKTIITNAEKFVKKGQIGAGDGVESGDATYGGVGYGNNGRPDLSNTAFFIEALRASGTKADDPAIQRALAFVSRCQNHESEFNNTPFAAKNPDGGFYYTPAGKGSSLAGTTDNGGLRSYGAMSYAGLKSMIYAGLTKDDPRVKAALEWAKQNYAVDSNPGLGSGGLYYYLHLMSTAMHAAELNTLEDKNGTQHEWRSELVAELAKRQQESGAWTNDNNKWLEGDPNLVTGYALLTLAYCKPESTKPAAKPAKPATPAAK